MIIRPTVQDYDELVCLWEASVRSTHPFLTEDDIQFYKLLVRQQYLPIVELYIIRNRTGRITAFMGLSRNRIEMLFVHPEEQGKGYGKQLIKYAIYEKNIHQVDVNEQNEKAYNFYKHLNFQVTGREDKDAMDKPFPILHLQLMRTPCIETSRLLLRPFIENDLPDFFDCCRNPHLGNNAGWKPHENIEESNAFFQSVFLDKENVWAIKSKETNRVIGSIGLIDDPKRDNPQTGMLGYWLKESHWGHGLMTEAVQAVLKYGFESLNLSLISANCYPSNLRSQKVLERNGFIYEGTLHQAERIYTGEVYDHVCYYVLSPFINSHSIEK